MRLSQCALLVAASLSVFPATAQKSEIVQGQKGTITEVGDVLQIALPAGALVGSLWIGDKEGAWQLTKGVATTVVATHSLKLGFGKLRPDASTHNSFPSGHTSAAFSGAAFLHHRYGNAWAIPAYGAASFVGASRLYANRHYLDDVISGASIAVFSSLYWTSPYASNEVVVTPSVASDRVAVNFSYALGAATAATTVTQAQPSDFDYRYELVLGGARTKHNWVNYNSNQQFGLHQFDQKEEPSTFASAMFTMGLQESHQLLFNLTPFEGRDSTKLTAPIQFGDVSYDAGDEVISAYRLWGLSADYNYRFNKNSDWITEAGVGALVQYQRIELDQYEGGKLSSKGQWLLWPVVNATLGYRFNDDISLSVNGRYSKLGSDDYSEVMSRVNYQINPQWNAALNYGYYQHQYEKSELANKVAYDVIGLTLGYSF
ncbi:phosphatase PAP2 family protein [Paraferrimonas haliotis]|uniref:undecaprenyl-diphosphate phosphatase n=1 Tax=Paraferrimonas haliotis TaxID=2013866 RepID=A0AA37WWS8_9GAMM|nr:phosphatase PAP2 family protein [Paraferrimonas haliotis]GLS82699.1 hypothetical protein GCM10007894_06760 [Paraferrimonas haliotis]